MILSKKKKKKKKLKCDDFFFTNKNRNLFPLLSVVLLLEIQWSTNSKKWSMGRTNPDEILPIPVSLRFLIANKIISFFLVFTKIFLILSHIHFFEGMSPAVFFDDPRKIWGSKKYRNRPKKSKNQIQKKKKWKIFFYYKK